MVLPNHDLGIDAMAESPDRWLQVELLEGVAPLPANPAPANGRYVPEALEGILFTEPAPDRPQWRSFALLDAGAYRLLPETLEFSEIRHKCLFTGKMLKDGADAAPWLIELEPDHRFTRQLMSTDDFPGGLWQLNLGLIIRTTMDFDTLWTHCRKFTRIQDAEGKWLYHRYWSPPVSTRTMALGNRPELAQFVSPFFPPTETGFEVLFLNADMHARLSRHTGTTPPTARPVLTKDAHKTIRRIRQAQQYEELIEITLENVAGKTEMDDDTIRANLRAKRDWYFTVGFWQRDHIVKLLVWEVLLGPEFVDTYAKGTIRAIIASAKAPYEAIMNIEFFLEAQEIRRLEAEAAATPEGGV